jgi:hypothetical protein
MRRRKATLNAHRNTAPRGSAMPHSPRHAALIRAQRPCPARLTWACRSSSAALTALSAITTAAARSCSAFCTASCSCAASVAARSRSASTAANRAPKPSICPRMAASSPSLASITDRSAAIAVSLAASAVVKAPSRALIVRESSRDGSLARSRDGSRAGLSHSRGTNTRVEPSFPGMRRQPSLRASFLALSRPIPRIRPSST